MEAAIERELLRVLTPGAIEAALASAERSSRRPRRPGRCSNSNGVRRSTRPVARSGNTTRWSQRTGSWPTRWNGDGTRRWNAWRPLSSRLAALREAPPPLPPPDRAVLLALAHDFSAVWADPATDPRLKKRVTRLLIEEVRVAPATEQRLDVLIHWAGGIHTSLHVRRNRSGEHRRCTAREVVDVVRDLARQLPDAQIARILNRLGYRTGAGNTWTATTRD